MDVSKAMALAQQQPQQQHRQQQQQQHLQQQQQLQRQKASLQLAYQDALRVCNPDFKRPFTSLEDACERLLPYHVVADYEAEEDDKILDSASTGGPILSRSQQWDNNIAAKVVEFTTTFEKQVLAFNIISRKRGLGEFRTEEKLMVEQLLLQDERRSFLELRAQMDNKRQKAAANHENAEAHMGEMMGRGPIRGSSSSSYGVGGGSGSGGGDNAFGPRLVEQDQDFNEDDVVNGWGGDVNKDDKEPSEDFLNDDEAENGDSASHGAWRGGELDLNAR